MLLVHFDEPQPVDAPAVADPVEGPAAVRADHREGGVAERAHPGGVGDAHRIPSVGAKGLVEDLHPAAVRLLAALRHAGAGDGGEIGLVPDGQELEAAGGAGGDGGGARAPLRRRVPEVGDEAERGDLRARGELEDFADLRECRARLRLSCLCHNCFSCWKLVDWLRNRSLREALGSSANL